MKTRYHKFGRQVTVCHITDKEDMDLNGKTGRLVRKHKTHSFANRDPQTIFGEVGIELSDGTRINVQSFEYEYI